MTQSRSRRLADLMAKMAACRICRDNPAGSPLPHEPRPVFQVSHTARILIAGQAPGTRVHASGRPFTDPSGDRLRQWLGVTSDVFYDAERIAILPMGFCFPGLTSRGADLPPRRECAPAWRDQCMAALPAVSLIICLGGYAMAWHMKELAGERVNDAVTNWRKGMKLDPPVMPLPHPSWRNNSWLKANPWFEAEVLPVLRKEVAKRLT